MKKEISKSVRAQLGLVQASNCLTILRLLSALAWVPTQPRDNQLSHTSGLQFAVSGGHGQCRDGEMLAWASPAENCDYLIVRIASGTGITGQLSHQRPDPPDVNTQQSLA